MREGGPTVATLKSVARATGFSVTTVSRALGGFDDVNPETRQVIVAEARRQGYEPNTQARALQTQRTQTIGLIVAAGGPRFPDPFFAEFVAGVGSYVSVAGFDLLLSTHVPVDEELTAYRRMVAGRRVDGLILLRSRYDDPRIAYLSTTQMPFVVFGRTAKTVDYAYMDVDGTAGQRALTLHFAALGHRRIAYISPPADLMFAHWRIAGYRDGLAEAGLPFDDHLMLPCALDERSGRDAAIRLLNLPQPPTAIMAANDLSAFGVMAAIQARGLRVGEDVAVGGFDDIPSAEHIHPGLTTVRQAIYEIGQQMAEVLLRLVHRQPLAEHGRVVTPQLMIRASSGPQRSGASANSL